MKGKTIKTTLIAVAMILILIMSVLLLTRTGRHISTGGLNVMEDKEFGNTYIGLSIDQFNDLGFSFGDSVDIFFDNGMKFRDVPYYSGYYTPVGGFLLCGYPGYPHPMVTFNYGDPTWLDFGISKDTEVVVVLNEKGKYRATEDLNALHYSDKRSDYDSEDRSEYESDAVFANFREVRGGNLKDKAIYRSASPCDDKHNRAAYANRFAEKNRINFVINLSDSEESYRASADAPGFASTYYDSLYKAGNVLLMGLNANYRSDDFANKIAGALVEMTKHPAPCLIHCVEGKDRTGFACALILALAGATPEEIIDDYMLTYANYYGIIKEKEPERYDAILVNVKDFLYCMCDADEGTPLSALNLRQGAENYLCRGGLSKPQIERIREYISK